MKYLLLLILSICANKINAQKNENQNELYLGFTFGTGLGTSPIFIEKKVGLSGLLNLSLEFKKNEISIGVNGTSEIQILGGSYPSISTSSIDIMYGRVLYDKPIIVIAQVGVGYVKNISRGLYLYNDPGFFGPSYYEKFKLHTIGIPISLKTTAKVISKYSVGLELYANINNKFPFYSINVVHQFRKFRISRK